MDYFGSRSKPGAGKSTLMKFAYSQARTVMKDSFSIAFFFNARGTALEKDTTGMFRSLLYQTFLDIPDTQDILDEVGPLALPRPGSSGWRLETLMDLLILATQKLDGRRLQIYVDALDECDEDQIREMVRFFEDLGESAIAEGTRLLVCFSSRHYSHITVTKKIDLILEDEKHHSEDIEIYTRSQLRIGKSLDAEQIHAELLRRSAGIFIWIILVVRVLNKAYDHGHLHALQEKLREIPDDLGELFASILTHDNQNVAEMRVCILWVLFATRPLTRPELFTAIRLATGSDVFASPGMISEADMESFILSASKGLTEFTQSFEPTAQFIHESVRDFLLSDAGRSILWPDIEFGLAPYGHQVLRHSCLIYSGYWLVYYDKFARGDDHVIPVKVMKANLYPQKQCFLHYAVFNLFWHAEQAALGETDEDLFLKVPAGLYVPVSNIVYHWKWSGGRTFESDSTMLSILAEYNCPKLIRSWLHRNPNPIGPIGARYQSPLRVALILGHEATIRALLTPFMEEDTLLGPPSDSQISAMIDFHKKWMSPPTNRSLIWSSWSLPWFFLRNASDDIALAVIRSGHFDLAATDPS